MRDAFSVADINAMSLETILESIRVARVEAYATHRGTTYKRRLGGSMRWKTLCVAPRVWSNNDDF
jgi:hypothetical protein